MERFDDYMLIKQLGEGGMGKVFQGYHKHEPDKPVAVKVMNQDISSDPTRRERFMREAQTSAKIFSNHIVSFISFGIHKERLFLVSELVEGGDLHSLVQQCGAIGESRALSIVSDCVEGLCALQEQGVIHRDVKPQNILIDRDGMAKLTDFGLVKIMQSGKSDISATDRALGTPVFMSPEQARGEKLTARSDIYSLGATLFFLLTERYLHEGDSTLEIVHKVAEARVPDIKKYRPRTSPAICKLLEIMLAPHPRNRPESPYELKHLLRRTQERRNQDNLLDIAPSSWSEATSKIARTSIGPQWIGRTLLLSTGLFISLLVLILYSRMYNNEINMGTLLLLNSFIALASAGAFIISDWVNKQKKHKKSSRRKRH